MAEAQLDALIEYLLDLRAKIGLGRDLSPEDLQVVREWWALIDGKDLT